MGCFFYLRIVNGSVDFYPKSFRFYIPLSCQMHFSSTSLWQQTVFKLIEVKERRLEYDLKNSVYTVVMELNKSHKKLLNPLNELCLNIECGFYLCGCINILCFQFVWLKIHIFSFRGRFSLSVSCMLVYSSFHCKGNSNHLGRESNTERPRSTKIFLITFAKETGRTHAKYEVITEKRYWRSNI